jgi:hypothetical protein
MASTVLVICYRNYKTLDKRKNWLRVLGKKQLGVRKQEIIWESSWRLIKRILASKIHDWAQSCCYVCGVLRYRQEQNK